MSLKDIISLIRQHKKMNENNKKHDNSNDNKAHSESFSYGKVE